jgi:tetratricopeptide (TPR) repeat protein
MSSATATPGNSSDRDGPPWPLITPALRRQLQQNFDQAQRLMSLPKYDHRSVHARLAECIVADPGNRVYVDAFLQNLARQYHHNKRGSRFQLFHNRRPFSRALAAGDWRRALQAGAEILRVNPWHLATLRGMAEACGQLELGDVELRYLEQALDAHPQQAELHRHYAQSLARQGRYDEALQHWRRVSELNPRDPEASVQIAKLQATPPPPDPQSLMKESAPAREEQLEQALAAAPTHLPHYLTLADAYCGAGRLADAEAVLHRALAVSGHALTVRERLDAVYLARLEHQLAIAERRAEDENTASATELVRQLRDHLNRVELEIFGQRARRYPADSHWKLEFSIRLKRTRNYSEALKQLAEIHAPPALAAQAALETGECWQHLRQFPRALAAYRRAVELTEASGEPAQQKLALYRGGVLGIAMGDPVGRECLQQLVDIDPTYRDAAQRLAAADRARL